MRFEAIFRERNALSKGGTCLVVGATIYTRMTEKKIQNEKMGANCKACVHHFGHLEAK